MLTQTGSWEQQFSSMQGVLCPFVNTYAYSWQLVAAEHAC